MAISILVTLAAVLLFGLTLRTPVPVADPSPLPAPPRPRPSARPTTRPTPYDVRAADLLATREALAASAPPARAPANGAARTAMLAELQRLRTWAERLPIYTRATWASDLVAMRDRATALHARDWPTAETARLLADARALRARIAA